MFATGFSRSLLTIAVALGFVLVVAPALGQPENPPEWWGSDDGATVTLGFQFGDNSSPPQPDESQLPTWYDQTTWTTTGDVGWHEQMGGRQGVIGLASGGQSGTLTVRVDNLECPPSVKKVWLQFDSYCNQAGIAWGLRAPSGSTKTETSRDVQRLADGWVRHTYEYEIDPQPAWEEFHCRFATAESGGECAIDNLSISTQCELDEDEQDKAAGLGFDFPQPEWPPYPGFENDPNWYDLPEWDRYGWEPDWMPALADHEGVFGLPGGGEPQDGGLVMRWNDFPEPEGTKYVRYEFDFYMAEGGGIHWEPSVSPDSYVMQQRESVRELEDGWARATIDLAVSPPPEWHEMHWHMFAGGFRSGPVAIDNLIVSTSSQPPRPVKPQPEQLEAIESFDLQKPPAPAPQWRDNFEGYVVGTDLHGQGGWKGWGNEPAFGAEVTDAEARTGDNSVDISGDADLVQEFDAYTSGRWALTAWQYIPADFQGGGGDLPGTFLVMMNTYSDGGPWEAPDWSVQLQFDSNDGMLKVYYGNGMNTVDVPYVVDGWARIRVLIDLDTDWTQVYYDDALIAEYSWTGGVLGGGGGAPNIAALDLFANGSTPVYYDNVSLKPVR